MQVCRYNAGDRMVTFDTPNERTPQLSESREDPESKTRTTRKDGRKTMFGDIQGGEECLLPQSVWLMLKIICVFWQRRLIVRRRCFHCQMSGAKLVQKVSPGGTETNLTAYFDADGQGYEHADAGIEPRRTTNEGNVQCRMCDSYWWNYEGKVRRYTEQEIGVKRWNHSRSSLLSVLALVTLLVINACDIFMYIRYQSGQSKYRAIHILSYAIYLTELSFYPLMCLYSKLITSTQGAAPRLTWATALNARFIIKRMQFLDLRRQGLPGRFFLFLCYAWPLTLVIYRLFIYLYLCPHLGHLNLMRIISLLNALSLMIIWSSAQYIMYLCRRSFQCQLHLVERYIKDNQTDLDFCRQLVWHAARDFDCYRRYVLVYMRISVPYFTWGATTVLCWQYAQGFKHDDNTCFSIVVLVWLQIVMFPTLSILSSGGLDVSYMWEHFRIRVLTTRRDKNSQFFWRKLCYHIEHVGVDSQRVSWTMVFSFISSFMAIYSSDAD